LEEPKRYSFVFDEAGDTWVCSVHGETEHTAWVPCYAGCDDGQFDAYEHDPINCEPGEMETCSQCKGNGGWTVCAQCNADNPHAEF
jgi:hypothetical protein